MIPADDPTNGPNNTVRLLVGGKEYGGWKSVRIEAGIERQSRSFVLEVTDRWPGQTDIPRRIRPGDACEVFIGLDRVLTGYVDATPIQYDATRIGVGVKGRSKTADLVDCCPVPAGQSLAAVVGPWRDVVGKDGKKPSFVPPPPKSAAQWRQQKLETIAAALAAPYGVGVVAEVDTGKPIAEHQVQQGETIFESIDRMMRLRHVLSSDNALGDLVFVTVGSGGRANTALELGKNVREGSADLDYTGVFSEYIVKGQRAGDDDSFAGDVSEGEGTSEEAANVSDGRATRRRVLVIKQSGQADEGTCQDRANYERAHRAAKALQASYTVVGWRQQDGTLWQPNTLVRVRDPVIGFDADMLIAELAWVLDDKGMRTEVRVGPPDGYVNKPKAAAKGKGSGSGAANWGDVK
jgi:prophage tail gpP-like protein